MTAKRKTRRSKSRLLRLPPRVLKKVNEMILAEGEGGKTYSEIAAWVKRQGFQTSESAVGRYALYLFGTTNTARIPGKAAITRKRKKLHRLLSEVVELFDSIERHPSRRGDE